MVLLMSLMMLLRAGLAFGEGELVINENGFNGMKWGSDIREHPNLILKMNNYDVLSYYANPEHEQGVMFGDIKLKEILYVFYKGKFCTVQAKTPASDARNARLLLKHFEEVNGPARLMEAMSIGKGYAYVWNCSSYYVLYFLYEDTGKVMCGVASEMKKALIETGDAAREKAKKK
jgi:hypothetical protein